MYGWMDGWVDGWMDGCLCCTYVCDVDMYMMPECSSEDGRSSGTGFR